LYDQIYIVEKTTALAQHTSAKLEMYQSLLALKITILWLIVMAGAMSSSRIWTSIFLAMFVAMAIRMLFSREKKQDDDVVVYCDTGADADDQAAIKALLLADVHFTLVIGGKGNLKHWHDFAEGDESLKKTPAALYDNGVVPPVKLEPKTLIILAPGIDKSLEKIIATSRLENVYYMGNLPVIMKEKGRGNFTLNHNYVMDTRSAFNDTGSNIFFGSLDKNVEVHVVTTEEAVKTPFSNHVFEKYMFTDSQRKTVIANTFTQALGRMNQNHAYNQFAEGLINPDKKGANYNTLLQLNKDRPLPEPSSELKAACDGYIACLGEKCTDKETRRYLLELCLMVTNVVGFEPLDELNNLIVSSDPAGNPYRLDKKYADQYAAFSKNVKSFTPAYDLVTVERYLQDISFITLISKTVSILSLLVTTWLLWRGI